MHSCVDGKRINNLYIIRFCRTRKMALAPSNAILQPIGEPDLKLWDRPHLLLGYFQRVLHPVETEESIEIAEQVAGLTTKPHVLRVRIRLTSQDGFESASIRPVSRLSAAGVGVLS